MVKQKKVFTKITAFVLSIICVLSVVCVGTQKTQAAQISWDKYYNVGIQTFIESLLKDTAKAGPVASKTLATFLTDILGFKTDTMTTTQLKEINDKLSDVSKDLGKVLANLDTDNDARVFNETATSIDGVSNNYLQVLTEINEKEKTAVTDKDIADLQKYKEERLPAIVGETFDSNSYYNKVQTLGTYLLGEGLGQNKGAIESFYEYCKYSSNFCGEAAKKSENYESYAMAIYSKAIKVLLTGLYAQYDCATTDLRKQEILNNVQSVLEKADKVYNKNEQFQETKANEKTNYIKYNGSQLQEIAIKNNLTTYSFCDKDSYKLTDNAIDFKMVKDIINLCPNDMTLRQYFKSLGFSIADNAEYLVISPTSSHAGASSVVASLWCGVDIISLDDVSRNVQSDKQYYSWTKIISIFCHDESVTSNTINAIILEKA